MNNENKKTKQKNENKNKSRLKDELNSLNPKHESQIIWKRDIYHFLSIKAQ